MARTSNIALRLLASLKAEAERVAKEEGTSLNQFINVAVAEKLAALRTARYFQERAARADAAAFERLLARSGNEPPRPGDEIPPDYDPEAVRRRSRRGKSRSE
jgi:hypothetical protein